MSNNEASSLIKKFNVNPVSDWCRAEEVLLEDQDNVHMESVQVLCGNQVHIIDSGGYHTLPVAGNAARGAIIQINLWSEHGSTGSITYQFHKGETRREVVIKARPVGEGVSSGPDSADIWRT